MFYLFPTFDECRIVICSLAGQYFVVIKTDRQGFEVPLANDSCLVTGFAEYLRECLLGAVKLNFDFLTRLQPKRVLKTGLLGALLLGLVMGLAGSQCATPLLVAILGIVMAKGKLLAGAGLLFVYGLGRGVPVVLAGTFTGTLRALPALERWTGVAEKIAGLLLLGLGLYFLWLS